MFPRISVVIPTYRRHDLLQQCLNALKAQQFPCEEYEVVVADDAADERTRSLVESLGESSAVAIRYVGVHGNHGPAAARNCGWQQARAEVIAFTDDDCIPDAGWLRHGLAAIAAGADAVAGGIVMPLPETPTDYERDAAGLSTSEFATANCFCRRESLLAIGGFDERFTAAWREDSDLQFSLLTQQKQIVRCEEAVVVHPIRPAPWGISLRQQRKTIFNALLFKKHPQLYRQRLPAFPRGYYWNVALLVIAGLGLVFSIPLLLCVAGIGWIILTLEFCLKRLRGTSHAAAHVCEMIVTSILIPPLSLYWHLHGMIRFRAANW